MVHFKFYEGGQKRGFLDVCVVVHFTVFLGGPANGIKRVGTFRGFGTERARLGTFRGFGTERARLGTF